MFLFYKGISAGRPCGNVLLCTHTRHSFIQPVMYYRDYILALYYERNSCSQRQPTPINTHTQTHTVSVVKMAAVFSNIEMTIGSRTATAGSL